MPEVATTVSVLEATKKEAEAQARAAVDAKIRHFKRVCLTNHLKGETSPGCINPGTLTDDEQKAVLSGLSGKSSKAASGSQDSVDVCIEYLKGNKEAADDFKARLKE